MAEVAAPPRSARSAPIAGLVRWNTERIHRADPHAVNPVPVDDEEWCTRLRASLPAIRAEWTAFEAAQGRLPHMEDLLGSWQGNVGGWWKTGGLISRRRPRGPLARLFPATVSALLAVPDLLSASWSVLGPGAELPVHTGLNSGAYNLLVSVHYPVGCGHEINGQPVALEGSVVLFDDTSPHAAWNRSDEPRVMLHGDVLRRLRGIDDTINAGVQWASHWLTPCYRNATSNGAELHRVLNE